MPILLFQMGKVASTAIAAALKDAGLAVLQAHIASGERLQQKLAVMTSGAVDDTVAERMYRDYLQELQATFVLARGRAALDREREPLRVITLSRDPVAWYRSNFIQNYDHNSSLLQRYHTLHHGGDVPFSPDSTLEEVQRTIFTVLEATDCALDSASALPELMAEADARDPSNVVFSQLNRFLLPFRWFDEDFRPATGIDIYSHGFDREAGHGRITVPGLSVLVLRYENLADLTGEIADFTGLPALDLDAVNVSGDKGVPVDQGRFAELLAAEMPATVAGRLSATAYARYFGYEIAHAGHL